MLGYTCSDIEEAAMSRPRAYPTWTYDRGQIDESPFACQALEVRTEPRIGRRGGSNPIVDAHRIEGATLDPGRVLTHPSRFTAPNLISGNQPQTFDRPHYIMSWAPNPIVQHSYGQNTLAVDDMRHTTPKQLLGYSYNALSQQEIVDAAALQVRQSLYGK